MKSSTQHRSRSTADLTGDARAATDRADPALVDSLRERLRAAIARPGSEEQIGRALDLLAQR